MDAIATNCIYEILNESLKEMSEESSSTTDSEEEILLMERDIISRKARIEGYVPHIVPRYTNTQFQEYFRTSRTSVELIIQDFEPSWMPSNERRPRTKFKVALLLTLWTLGNQECFRTISDRFGLSIATAHSTFLRVCQLLYNKREKYIVWPQGAEADLTVKNFAQLRQIEFPNVLGCVDGTHVAIPGPLKDNSFYNRKGYHSFLIQAVCDSTLHFTDIYVGWPGSVHDAKVWTSSPLYKALKNNEHFIKKEYHLLADSAYPLDRFLLKPYKDNGHLNAQQVYFNTVLSSTRIVIEQAFGRLKGTFRRLKYLHCFKLSSLKVIAIASCILHNIAVGQNDEGFYEEPREAVFLGGEDDSGNPQPPPEASTKRDQIAELLYERNLR